MIAWMLAWSLMSDRPLYYDLLVEVHRREAVARSESKVRGDESERCEACDLEPE